MAAPALPPVVAWFLERIDKAPSGCWEWQGSRNERGYGQVIRTEPAPPYRNLVAKAHRYAYTLFVGPIPSRLSVLHRCDNPPCCNPEHLYLGSAVENMRDRLERGRNPFANRTHCRYGHEYTPENTYVKPGRGYRECRTCKRRWRQNEKRTAGQ